MYVKCSQCKARHRVTDENVRADGSSVKCRKCDTVIYFKNSPPVRLAPREPSKPVSMHAEKVRTKGKKEYSKPVSVPAKQVLKEEKREQKRPVNFPAKRDKEKEHRDTTMQVRSPVGTKTDEPSTVQSVFGSIAEKLDKLSVDDSTADFNPFKNINLGDKSTRRIIIFILVGIFLVGLVQFILSKI